MKKSILLFNPRSCKSKPRLPNSILSLAATLHPDHPLIPVDGNLEKDPWEKINRLIEEHSIGFFGCTVMPGPQLIQATDISRRIHAEHKDITVIWGGYFPSNHPQTVMKCSTVDYIISGLGHVAFRRLIDHLSGCHNESIESIPNLIYRDEDGNIHENRREKRVDLDAVPPLPYELLEKHYPLDAYLGKTFLGARTFAYHSSFGCPHQCSFCGVTPVFQGCWSARSAERMFQDIVNFKQKYSIDAIEFHDNNFFASKERVLEFTGKMTGMNMLWWGEGRIDCLLKYSMDELRQLRAGGCRSIFMGAESSDPSILSAIDKGGNQSCDKTLLLNKRLAEVDILPEFSFVLGFPAASQEELHKNLDNEFQFIKKLKRVNPQAEIVLYTYSPVGTDGSALNEQVCSQGFNFPSTLDEWLTPEWQAFELRKDVATPWLSPATLRRISHFETVLHGMYPSRSDLRIRGWKRAVLRSLSWLRYRTNFFHAPREISYLLEKWDYRKPEIEGFYSE